MAASGDDNQGRDPRALSRIALVVHPSRDIDQPLQAVRDWCLRRGVEIVQIEVPGQDRRVAEVGDPAGCQLILAIGGDGTMLAALRAGGPANCPVVGVASGSLGVLAAVTIDDVAEALDRFCQGRWRPRAMPGLAVQVEGQGEVFALNDISVVRNGAGQVRTTASVNGTVFGRFAGDGCIVSTPIGSSAYSLSAGGPLLTPEVKAFLLTPLPFHGGFCPPIVVDHASQLELTFSIGYGGARFELDGQVWEAEIAAMKIGLREKAATIVAFDDQQPFVAALRDRQIILDSPRIVAEAARRSLEHDAG
jgi:NAD+ kinase